jgi:hypothetical protein
VLAVLTKGVLEAESGRELLDALQSRKGAARTVVYVYLEPGACEPEAWDFGAFYGIEKKTDATASISGSEHVAPRSGAHCFCGVNRSIT